ncbi:polymorphic toxin-type HINT domain-containing protein [Streptomyces sp. NPDC058613]|uniref:polymorphic toxin-type HINT domain-containing protein n=1 Tax=Streptomyces sp. NPDC058613 TaxID=3346556 RepID=UPI003666E370
MLGEGVKELVEIAVTTDGGTTAEPITATDGHPFWVAELARWVDATDLEPGQWLQTDDGTRVQVAAVKRWESPQTTVYNLTVTDLHTYYVLAGATPVLVHNCPTAGTGKAPRTPDGKFSKRNGEPGTDGSLDERTVMDQLELDGAPIFRGQVHARVDDFPLRKYDGAVQIDGRWLGVETKGGTSPLPPPQRRFDDWLNTPGNSVTTSGGMTLEGTFNAWVPR